VDAEPSIALVFSPDTWVEQLHRFVADHGGARVRQLVVDPAVLDDEDFDVLVTGDRWPSLNAALVARMHARRALVLGVFDAEEPAGKDHLLSVGADAVIAADAPPAEMVALLAEQMANRAVAGATDRADAASADHETGAAAPLLLVTGFPGSGATEVALALGVEFARRAPTLLLDARLAGAGTSVRLGLPLSPNLRSAVDDLLCGGDPTECVLTLVRSGLHVLTGFPNAASAGQVSVHEVHDVIAALRPTFSRLVVLADDDVRCKLAPDAEAVVVSAPTPLGIARVASLLTDLRGAGAPGCHAVVNRAPRDRFRIAELRAAVSALEGVESVHVLPDDPHVGEAAWEGVVVSDGPFVRGVALIAALHAGARGGRRTRRRRLHARRLAGGRQ
jgi:MinD-like ATPase involved in chromosome partitioning or flagellar assembly